MYQLCGKGESEEGGGQVEGISGVLRELLSLLKPNFKPEACN